MSHLLSRLTSLLSFTVWFLTTYSHSCFACLYPLSCRTRITQPEITHFISSVSCWLPCSSRQCSHGQPLSCRAPCSYHLVRLLLPTFRSLPVSCSLEQIHSLVCSFSAGLSTRWWECSVDPQTQPLPSRHFQFG